MHYATNLSTEASASARPIRVLHVLNEIRPSGAERVLLASIPTLRRQSIHVEVLATGEALGEYASAFSAQGVSVHHLPFRPRPTFLTSLADLARNFDLVHVHVERASFWVCAALRAHGLPVVRTLHSIFPFCGRLRVVRGLQRRSLARLGVRFVSVSSAVQRNELSRFALETVLIHNPVEDRFLEAAKSRVFADEVGIILSVGNCTEAKNHEAILEAIAAVNARGRSLTYRHVGEEDDANINERELAQELGIDSKVSFIGRVDDPLQALLSSDLFLMPSRREGFGLAALEALASGSPTILSRIEGFADFDGMPSITWAETDSDSLACAIEEVLRTPREVRAHNGARTAEAARQFSQSVSIGKLLALYRLATNQPRGSRPSRKRGQTTRL